MPVTSAIAGTIGTAVLLGGATAGGIAISKSQKKAEKRRKQVRAEEFEARERATAELLSAPEKAAERARLESLQRRRRRARTVLTSPTGVAETGELAKKTLLGA